jgi:glycosyltransferase involved in cell wall biosynthesis
MGARVILDLHDLMPEFFAAKFNKSINGFVVKIIIWQEQLSCRFADHVITVTDNWKETLIKRGLPPSKVSVVMNLADERVFCQSNSEGEDPKSNGHFQLFYHGNLTYRYGIDLAIRAVGIVQNQIPDIQLHIHGWGDYSQKLVELTKELGLKDHIHFSSQSLPTSALPELIRQADVCLVPYRNDIFTDGILPTKLMEYAALGIPVIAAQTTTISRYFDGSMVQFFNPGDAQGLANCIISLYLEPSRLSQLIHGIIEFNRKYRWSDLSANYTDLVRKLGQN